MKQRIIDYIQERGQSSADEMTNFFGISRQIIHRHLSQLVKAGFIYRIGKPPQVYYLISGEEKTKNSDTISESLKKIINENYLVITPSGDQKEGWDGFTYWCNKQKLPVEKTAIEYERTLKKYAPYKKDGLIDGMYKIKHTFDHIHLDEVFYLDFYSIERFGKTKLGQLLLYAKQSQNKDLIHELVVQIKPKIDTLLKKFDIEYYASTGAPSLYASDLVVKEGDKVVGQKRVIVNDPLDIHRVRFYQASWGMTEDFRSAKLFLAPFEPRLGMALARSTRGV